MDGGRDLELALDRADAACRGRGAQLTELRRQVLGLVLAAGQPVGAYALLDRLRAARPGAAPPTVYRALDFLLDQGLIHRIERLNAFVPCADIPCGAAGDHGRHHHGHDHHPHDHPHQFLICRRCGATAELCDPAVAAAVAGAAGRAGFVAQRVTVEVEGLCGACAGAEGSERNICC